MTIPRMIEAIANKEQTSQQLVSQYIDKIKENSHLNAVIEINPDAMDIAKKLDESAEVRGVLHGIPILIKDNVNTGDKMQTTAGSLSLEGNIAAKDADAVELLRASGAVILGKANMTEFANYMVDSQLGAPMPNGYSSRGGQTVSTFGANVDTSGSSSGSAVAVAAGLCAAAVGSETFGSIISPSQRSGIVGLKPSAGLISGRGVIPISFTLDTLGPMASCVEDTGALLGALAGKQYACIPRTDLRVGLCRTGIDETNPWLEANEKLALLMQEMGIECVELPDHGIDTAFVGPIMRHEFRYGINSYLQAANNPALPQDLDAIIAYNEAHADKALKYGQSRILAANAIPSNWSEQHEYLEALAARKNAIETLSNIFDTYSLDVILMLSANCGLAAATGFPSLTLRVGTTSEGLPIGTCLIARPHHEEVLLSIGLALEAALR